jgi:hypothetical protein
MTGIRCSDGNLDAVEPSPQQDYEQLQLLEIDALIAKRVRPAREGGCKYIEYIEISTILLEAGVGILTNLHNNLLLSAFRRHQIVVPKQPESWPKDASRVIYPSAQGTVSRFHMSTDPRWRLESSQGDDTAGDLDAGEEATSSKIANNNSSTRELERQTENITRRGAGWVLRRSLRQDDYHVPFPE